MTSVGAGASSTTYACVPLNFSSGGIIHRPSQLRGEASRQSSMLSSSENVTNAIFVLKLRLDLILAIFSSTSAIFPWIFSMSFCADFAPLRTYFECVSSYFMDIALRLR